MPADNISLEYLLTMDILGNANLTITVLAYKNILTCLLVSTHFVQKGLIRNTTQLCCKSINPGLFFFAAFWAYARCIQGKSLCLETCRQV